MLRQTSIFALALMSGAATAGPLANTVNGLLGLGGPTAAPLTAPLSAAVTGPLSSLETAATPVTGAAPLPGLTPPKAGGPIGATVLNDGTSNPNSGYDNVVQSPILFNDAAGVVAVVPLVGPVLTDASNNLIGSGNGGAIPLPDNGVNQLDPTNATGGMLDVGVFDGDGTANAAGGIGAAVGSGSNTGNGTIGVGVGNDTNTGNGSAIGIAALSDGRGGPVGNNDGSGQLGISALNQGDALTVCGMGMCGGVGNAQAMTGNSIVIPSSFMGQNNPLITAAILAGDNQGNGEALISAAVLSGNNSGNGGTIALGVLSGDNVGQGGLVGAGVLTGDNSATGSIAAGVLTGNNSALTNNGEAGRGLLAAGVLTGNNSAAGTQGSSAPPIGVTALSPGQNSSSTTVAPTVKVGAITGADAARGGGGPALVTPGANPDDNDESAQNTDDSQLCQILAKDNRGRVKGKLREKAQCSKPKAKKA